MTTPIDNEKNPPSGDPVKLPGLASTSTDINQLRGVVDGLKEIVETREGRRSSKYEQSITWRDLYNVGLIAIQSGGNTYINTTNIGGVSGVTLLSPKLAGAMIEQFDKQIKSSQLYKDIFAEIGKAASYKGMPQEVVDILTSDLVEEARKRGADIQRVDKKITEIDKSLSLTSETLTASIDNAQAAIREVSYASVNRDIASAGKVNTLVSSLGNYYQDGTTGRAQLEQTLTTQAGFLTGLRAQYTMKVQAGGALAGFGIAATEINGTPSSAFIISADKFAIVSPTYTGGLTNNPDLNLVPFGVDSNGIYMNTNVYVRGTMRVDTGGKTLTDGLRGSLNLAITAASWTDAAASQAVWTALGKAGSPSTNNHLVAGDTVTASNGTSPPTFIQTKYWSGSAWATMGVTINGNLLVDGSITAAKVDTRGLTIKDGSGNIILSSGVPLEWQYLTSNLANAPSGILNSNVNAATIGAVKTDLTNAPAGILNSNVTATGIGAVATNLSNAPAGILNSNVTATSIGAVATNLSNAPSGILNNNITIGSNGTLSGAGGGTVTISGLDSTVVRSANPITLANVGTYIGTGAITNAYIGNFIQSSNYSPGSDGWQIDKGGSAEFNTLIVRSGQITGALQTVYKINSYVGLFVRISGATPISTTNGPYYLNGDTNVPQYLVFSSLMPAPATAAHKIFVSVNVQALGVSVTRDLAVLILVNAFISGQNIYATEQIAYNTNSGTFGICTNATGVTTNTYATSVPVMIFVGGFNAEYTIQTIDGMAMGVR